MMSTTEELIVRVERDATQSMPPLSEVVDYLVSMRRSRTQRALKRLTDIVLGVVLLVLLAPVAIVAMVAVKASCRGPLLFRQTRLGREGRPFTLLKFRTMCIDAEDQLQIDSRLSEAYERNNFKLVGDPRLTRWGRHLRRFSVDEIPQLINVLRGDMSLVGPRPIVHGELDAYADFDRAYVSVRPGLTGAWQVSGRNDVGYPWRAVIDFNYVTGWSLFGDFVILIKTVPVAIMGRGSS